MATVTAELREGTQVTIQEIFDSVSFEEAAGNP